MCVGDVSELVAIYSYCCNCRTSSDNCPKVWHSCALPSPCYLDTRLLQHAAQLVTLFTNVQTLKWRLLSDAYASKKGDLDCVRCWWCWEAATL